MRYLNTRDVPGLFWEFSSTQAQSRDVTVLMQNLIDRTEAGEPLPAEVALPLLRLVAGARVKHEAGSKTAVWAPGDTYEVCTGCGSQVSEVYRQDDTSSTPQKQPGICGELKEIDWVLRTALGLPIPTYKNPTGTVQDNPA